MKKTFSLFAVALFVLLLGCNKTEMEPVESLNDSPHLTLKSVASTTAPIIVDETIDGGTLTITNDMCGIHMVADLVGWEFAHNYIYVGITPPAGPAPGQLPYTGTLTAPNTVEFTISFDELGASTGDFYIAFRGKVKPEGGNGMKDCWALPENVIYFYNGGGGQKGWGGYFLYDSFDPLMITPTTESLSTVEGRVRYQNIRSGFSPGEEIFIYTGNNSSPDAYIDFDPANNYNFSPNTNHLILTYNSETGLFTALIFVENDYTYPIATTLTPGTDINTIQFVLKKGDSQVGSVLRLFNISINSVPIPPADDEYIGGDFNIELIPPTWNITGLSSACGVIILDADFEATDYVVGPDDLNYIEFRLGTL